MKREISMLISERIYEYLKKKEITQTEFANKTGISQSTISDWRRKGTNPSSDKIMIICDVLGISPYELLQGTENKKHKEYQPLDYIVVDRESEEFRLIETYQSLNNDNKKRLEGYIKALKDFE